MKSLAVKVFVILVGVFYLSGLASHIHHVTVHGQAHHVYQATEDISYVYAEAVHQPENKSGAGEEHPRPCKPGAPSHGHKHCVICVMLTNTKAGPLASWPTMPVYDQTVQLVVFPTLPIVLFESLDYRQARSPPEFSV